MGLKVLLADDSAAIRKVVQLCLQDFGVELKTVGNGKEVMELIAQFKPDIALIDVMLPHKSGYDVAAELKDDPLTKSLPVIMLWSSFMDFDEPKYLSSRAEGKLEKPFEAKDLRELIKKYVPKVQANPFLDHIEMPKLDSALTAKMTSSISNLQVEPPTPSMEVTAGKNMTEAEAWSMSSFIDIAKFSENNKEGSVHSTVAAPSDSDWVRKDLGKFKMDVGNSMGDENLVSFQMPENTVQLSTTAPSSGSTSATVPSSILKSDGPLLRQTQMSSEPEAPLRPLAPSLSNPNSDSSIKEAARLLLEKQITELIQAEARAIIEKAIWKIVPDMATQMIRDEIKRLTDG